MATSWINGSAPAPYLTPWSSGRSKCGLLGRTEPDAVFVTIGDATRVLRLKDQSWIVPPRLGVMCDILGNNAMIWKTGSKLAMLSRTGETCDELGAQPCTRDSHV